MRKLLRDKGKTPSAHRETGVLRVGPKGLCWDQLSIGLSRVQREEVSLVGPMQKSLLFVCLGNICRSPAAEGVFRSFLRQQAAEDPFRIDSAGTIGYHAGRGADPRMIQAAQKRGYQLLSRARQVTCQDLEQFDLVIPMDRDNRRDLLLMHRTPKSEIKLLSDFLDSSWPTDVPDPYYGGEEGFEYVLDMLETACPVILDYLREKRSFD